ncbi:MAG TPA: sigma factor-like helix-turn-helix DNA-binding protein [Mycobacteriales bacterium]|nr:sigma factor-like helix-turn-helix DNA-binding protein [Mycobacteriales bacterium]
MTRPVQAAIASHVPASYSLAVALLGPGPAAEDAVRAAVAGVSRNPVPPARAADRLLVETRQTARAWLCRSDLPEPERRQRAVASLRPRVDADNPVVTALHDLPAPERLVLQLAYIGCYTFAEIAALTEMPVATVRRLAAAGARTLMTSCGSPRTQT